MDFPRLYPVRQNFPDRRIADIPAEINRQLAASGFAEKLKPGARIALGVGSRGIANISTITGAVAAFWKSRGFSPFIFPAMGSHGAATAEGQADVLAHYGVHEATMGCPVVSSLDVVPIGKSSEGIEVFCDRNAFEADAIMPISRIKWHTDFAGALESGIFKMMAIGLGKFAGAQRYHTIAYRMGLERVIRSAGRQMLSTGKVIGGLAILEDAHHNTGHLEAVPAAGLEKREEELLALAKSWMGRIPMPLDILIVDELGKNISGAGMDTKVVNRSVYGDSNVWNEAPRIERVFVRGMSNLSYGNGVGVGLADVIHDRLLRAIDWTPTMINSLTASTPSAIKTPIHFPTDRECLERIAPTVGRLNLAELRIGWIRNSMELAALRLSENLLPEIRDNSLLEIVGDPEAFDFDAAGDLAGLHTMSAALHS